MNKSLVRVSVNFEVVSVVAGTLCGALLSCAAAVTLTSVIALLLQKTAGLPAVIAVSAVVITAYLLTGLSLANVAIADSKKRQPDVEDTLVAKLSFFIASAVGPWFILTFLVLPTPVYER